LKVDTGLGIDRRKGLIEQKQFRTHDDRTGKRTTLLHASGKLPGIKVGGVLESHGLQRHLNAFLAFALVYVAQAKRHVAPDG